MTGEGWERDFLLVTSYLFGVTVVIVRMGGPSPSGAHSGVIFI